MKSIKSIFNLAKQHFCSVLHWIQRKTDCDGNPMTDEQPLYPRCLNCGTQLEGMYCHKCGQYATTPVPKLFDFVQEYVTDYFFLENQTLPTFVNLIFRPGRLVKEYCSGRHMSYAHPMSINFLILLVLIALFSFVGTDAKIEDSLVELSSKEDLVSDIVLSTVAENDDYHLKMETSSRDTVKLASSFSIIDYYKPMVNIVEVVDIGDSYDPDILRVSVPTVFIEDKILVDRGDAYCFSYESDALSDLLIYQQIADVWRMLISFMIDQFPLLLFLTTPFMVMSIRFMFRQHHYPRVHFYIFSLYYLAFLGLMSTLLYIASEIFNAPSSIVDILALTLPFAYLAMALKQTYNLSSWFKSALAAIVVNVSYFAACLVLIILLSIITIVLILLQMGS